MTKEKSVLILSVVAVVISVGVIFEYGVKKDSNNVENLYKSDLEALTYVDPDFGSIVTFFRDISEEKGGVYGFELLKRAELPPGTDLHLVGHEVGNELYKQEGLKGMKFCTHDFRNACSHSVVIGALLEHGIGVFDDIHEVCQEAPGGPGAYNMCFHGFGHGVLAFTEYTVEDAVELCERTGTDEYSNREYHECVGGMVMEMLSGVHDREVWQRQAGKYLSRENPLQLCQGDLIPEEAKPICYTYISPEIFDAASEIQRVWGPETYEKSFAYCEAVEGEANRRACFEGLGKEFIVLVQERDIRKIEDTTDDQLNTVIEWCSFTEDSRGRTQCLAEILDSLYWGGENNFGVSVRYCNVMTIPSDQNMCFSRLIENVSYYHGEPKYREDFCKAIPETYQSTCEETLF